MYESSQNREAYHKVGFRNLYTLSGGLADTDGRVSVWGFFGYLTVCIAHVPLVLQDPDGWVCHTLDGVQTKKSISSRLFFLFIYRKASVTLFEEIAITVLGFYCHCETKYSTQCTGSSHCIFELVANITCTTEVFAYLASEYCTVLSQQIRADVWCEPTGRYIRINHRWEK